MDSSVKSIDGSARTNRARRLSRAAIAAVCILITLFIARLMVMTAKPEVALLLPENAAEWICVDEPIQLQGRPPENRIALFQFRFEMSTVPAEAPLTVRAFRLCAVRLNGSEILPAGDDLTQWKASRSVNLGPHLRLGENLLEIEAFNQNAPVAVLAHCDALDLRTDAHWSAAAINGVWSPARLASTPRSPEISHSFPTAERGLLQSLPIVLGAAALAIAVFRLRQYAFRFPWQLSLTVAKARWIIMASLIVLGINNIWKLPPDVGFDVEAHIAYMLHILEYNSIPLATDGWQMFQSPLYYLLSAPLAKFGLQFTDLQGLPKLLRIIPLLCCVLQVEVLYRAMRLTFPGRSDLQGIGLIAGSLLPMNVYISQYVGNEPLAGLFTSATICLLLAYSQGGDRFRSTRWLALMGFVYGLALLSKVTPVLIAPVVLAWIFSINWLQNERLALSIRHASMFFGVAAIVCGWYYVRNWMELGTPFMGGWDPARGIQWWQDPGYRTLGDFFRFGISLRFPVYASTHGFWDSLYSTLWTDGLLSAMVNYHARPPWNQNVLVALGLLAVIPTILLLAGVLASLLVWKRSIAHADRDQSIRPGALLLSVPCLVIYLAAMLDLYLQLPIYSTAKATYTLGLLPCYAILIAAGFDLLARRFWLRMTLISAIAAWAVCAYAAFFII